MIINYLYVFGTYIDYSYLPYEEESVNTICSVRNSLEPEFFLDHFTQLHVVGIFEHNNACVTLAIEIISNNPNEVKIIKFAKIT